MEQHGLHLAVERTGAVRERQLRVVATDRVQLDDGVVISVTGLTPDDLRRIELRRPAVLIGERDVPAQFDHVQMDNVAGSRLATAHLLARGSQHVAMFGGASGPHEHDMTSLRTDGYRAALRDAGLPVD